uniref:Uncharacterized protein n=1 Tax=Meloidogyne enterolobii TaxID=390850 RepID=A0A6V7XU22_MELEN|nr:unnamed protein product [Meloidogyne enterolobii]
MLCLLSLELDTGPWTRKSSTLCSLLLLIIAALAVLGQDKSEIVGFGNHTKNDNNVTLAGKIITSDKADFDFASCRFKELYPDACDVSIENGYIELRYNNGSKGCTVDLLSKDASNNSTIKFTAGVRNIKGGLSKCLDVGQNLDNSYNNTLPFVYSVNNKDIEKLNNRQYNDPSAKCDDVACQAINGKCMPSTSLQVSWSQLGGKVYAHTYLIGEDKRRGLSPSKTPVRENMTLDLEIKTARGFTMKYKDVDPFNASKGAVCVPESTPLFEPKAWTITNEEHSGKHLLVFSLLRQSAAYTYKEYNLAEPPDGPHCELFVRFDTNDYSLLFVDNSPTTTQPTTTTVTTTAAETSETTGATTSSATTPSTTANNFTSIRTTTQAATKCPEQREECGGAPYLAIGIAAAAGLFVGIVIAVLVWLWMKNKAGKDTKKGGKQDAERAEEDCLLALYKAEEKTKGKKAVGTFAAWKKNRKESETKTAAELSSIDDLIAATWKKVEKKKAMDKLQYLVDQFEKQKEKELFEREYKPELKKKGLAAVGSFEEWKKNKNIAATFTLNDGTRTAIEYEQPKVIEKIVEKAEKWTIEEGPTIEENRNAVDGVDVPKTEEEEEVDDGWIPPSEPNNNPREEI